MMNWKKLLQYGLISGVVVWFLSLVGMVETFDSRDVINNILSLAWAIILGITMGIGYAAAKASNGKSGVAVVNGVVTGLIGGVASSGLVWLIKYWENMREMFVQASPALVKILTFSQPNQTTGLLMLIGLMTVFSVIGATIYLLPGMFRRMLVSGLAAVLVFGMLQELLDVIFARNNITETLANFLFGKKGLSIAGAAVVFFVFAALSSLWATQKDRVQSTTRNLPVKQRRVFSWAIILISVLFLIILPQAVGPYITQILVLVGLYAMMGLGLNIDIGLAGLLDLGFVGFFAIGAYTVALLTSTSDLGIASVVAGKAVNQPYMSFWLAVPIAVLVAGIAGIILGIPVLRMRGDYLAIVTLGFAEIIRILVLSNFLQPVLGGAQGVLSIPKPGIEYVAAMMQPLPQWLNNILFFWASPDGLIKDPLQFYYLIVLGCILLSFIGWRLQHSRIGRNWIAMREDEDVAEAMGINLIATKLMAFGTGATFAGLSGAIFAAQVGSVFPHSFGMIVSINVLSLVIIGGTGNIPGVIVGALVLVGLPELLREFSEFRMLIYGALLVVMMLVKPEGFLPSEVRRRELHDDLEPVGQSV